MGWAAAGMGYVFQTENGCLLAVDGGLEENARIVHKSFEGTVEILL